MINLNEIITQIPVNSYVIVGCLILGYIIKKWLPTDNRIIPTVLPIIGAFAEACLEGPAITAIIGGALGGCIAVGLHQAFKQMIEAAGWLLCYTRWIVLIEKESETQPKGKG